MCFITMLAATKTSYEAFVILNMIKIFVSED